MKRQIRNADLWITIGWSLVAWLIVLVVAPQAHAQGSATLTCTPPMKNTDGSAITSAISYNFYHGTQSGLYPDKIASTACSLVWPSLTAGTHYFVATAIVGGVESAKSNAVSKLVTVPNAPAIPAPVSIAGPVFVLQTTDDALVILQIGTVVAGKPCDASQAISQAGKTYMLIPKASVTGLTGQQLTAVFGVCN